jgi:hypothetical protein
MKLRTVCETELWAGFFWINENGDQPECGQEIEIEIDEDCIEEDEYGIRPASAIKCPKCHTWLVWPQEWEVVKE